MKRTINHYYIKTFGCQMNFSDSERMESFLEKNQLKPIKNINQADLVIFNTCGVRQTAEDRVYGQIHNLRKKNESVFLILTGCLAHRKDVQRKLKEKVDLFTSINDFFNLEKQTLRQKLTVKNQSLINKKNTSYKDYLKTIPKYNSPQTILVPIMTGCNNFCSYCVVPYARGREKSRSPLDIFKEIKRAQKNECREVLLLGQNVNSYTFATKNSKLEKLNKNLSNVTFPVLLEYLAKNFPLIKFKFLTSHPKDFSDKLINVISQYKNISREIHLPLQSGSDKVLKDMNRPYSKKQYLKLIEKLHNKIIDVNITTDIIVGFPTETEKEFQETVQIFKKIKFNNAYINKYSPRPGTSAERLGDPITWKEKKKREKVLRNLI